MSAALVEFQKAAEEWTPADGDEAIDAILARGRAAFDSLTLEQRRTIIRGRYRISLIDGERGPDRVSVTPR